jgi:ABC-type uncharacterized transport system substrate-binding protein
MTTRRAFIGVLGGAAAWPVSARAQQTVGPVIGYLSSLSASTFAPRLNAFRRGLAEAGFVEGHNVAIEYRWAENQYEKLPTLMADLASRQVTVVAAMGGNEAARAAATASTAIPVVFAIGTDPVELGLVASLNRPGGNVTGVSFLTGVIVTKLLELLCETVPKATTIGFLVNPNSSNAEPQIRELRTAAESLGRNLLVVRAGAEPDIDTAFATLVAAPTGALLVGSDVFFFSRRTQIVALAARHGLPAIYNVREFTEVGGLMSYGSSVDDAQRQAGIYVGRILKGEKPADLPVQRAVKVELIVNLKTAKALGLQIPPTLLARADEVIE